jgi:hypothetical protein
MNADDIDRDIDRILADSGKIRPSSGFTASVMKAVRQNAAAPPPLRFPWRYALPGFIALPMAVALSIWKGTVVDPSAAAAIAERTRAFVGFAERIEIQWLALAVVATVLSAVLPYHLKRDAR